MTRPLPLRAQRQDRPPSIVALRQRPEALQRPSLRRRPRDAPEPASAPDTPRGLRAAAPHLVLLAVIVNVAACLFVAQLTGTAPEPGRAGRMPDLLARRGEPEARNLARGPQPAGEAMDQTRISIFRWPGAASR